MDLPKIVYPKLVREFYSNMRTLNDDFGLTSTIKGTTITLTPSSLSRILAIPCSSDEFYSTSHPLNFEHYDAFHVGIVMCKNNEANPKPFFDKLTMQSWLLYLLFVNNVVPRADHKDEVTHLDMDMMYPLLMMGRDINICYAIIRHMLSILRDTTHKVALPYSVLLTTIFYNFGVQLINELQKVEMDYVFQNDIWVPEGWNAHDDNVDAEIDDILGDQEGDNEQHAPTQEEENAHYGSSSKPLSGNYEEHFNMMNAGLDTLVENFDAFKIDQVNRHTYYLNRLDHLSNEFSTFQSTQQQMQQDLYLRMEMMRNFFNYYPPPQNPWSHYALCWSYFVYLLLFL